jgi:hypothetical protein
MIFSVKGDEIFMYPLHCISSYGSVTIKCHSRQKTAVLISKIKFYGRCKNAKNAVTYFTRFKVEKFFILQSPYQPYLLTTALLLVQQTAMDMQSMWVRTPHKVVNTLGGRGISCLKITFA